jgi:hypothetical protein
VARFIEFLSADEKEHYIANVDAISVVRVTKEVSPQTTIVFIGGEQVKAQILGDKAKEFREAMGLDGTEGLVTVT